MEGLLNVTVLFALALALSLLVERFLEILKATYDLLDSRFDWHRYWTKKTFRLKNTLENRLKVFEYVSTKKAATALQRVKDMMLNEQGGYSGEIPVLAGDLVRAVSIKVLFKFIGILVGIGLAFWLNLDIVKVWQEASVEGSKFNFAVSSSTLRIILTGITIGLGSGPMHKIITTMEKRRKKLAGKGV